MQLNECKIVVGFTNNTVNRKKGILNLHKSYNYRNIS
jgi:hypothetical protein